MTELIPLTCCRPGMRIHVAVVRTNDQTVLRKLAAFGILPGAEITVLQSSPAFVLQIEYTQLAIDQTLAAVIYGYRQNAQIKK